MVLLSSPTLRVGDLLLETMALWMAYFSAQRTRHVDVIVPLRSNMVAFDSVRLAE